jgi:hypothetical protein
MLHKSSIRWSSILLAFAIAGCRNTSTAQEGKSPEAVVKKLFSAISTNDTKTVLSLDYELQGEIGQVRANDPKFTQEAKLGELYSAAEKVYNFVVQGSPFEQSFVNRYRDLRFLLAYHPSIQIVEVRPRPSTAPAVLEVYVRLTFSSPAESPYNGMLTGATPIKQAMLQINLCDGKFLGSDRANFSRYDVMWQDAPLRITFVWFYHWGGDTGAFHVAVGTSGMPTKTGTLTIAGRKCELNGTIGSGNMADRWQKNGIKLAGASAILEMRTDTGQVSRVRFVVQGLVEGGPQGMATETFIPADVLANPWKKLHFPGTGLSSSNGCFGFQYDDAGSK